jgi:lantibiotic leader peptide-processing serine protease
MATVHHSLRVAAAAVALSMVAIQGSADEPPAVPWRVTGAIDVVFNGLQTPDAFSSAVQAAGGEIVFSLDGLGVATVRGLSAAAVQDLALANDGLATFEDVAVPVEATATGVGPQSPDPTEGLQFSPETEPFFGLQWGLRLIGADQAIAAGHTGHGARVAVIDSGVYYDHPDLSPNYDGGANFFAPFCHLEPSSPPNVCDPADPLDTVGHGTWVTGITVGAVNGFGILGVAPETRFVALRACGGPFPGSCPLSSVLAAIRAAADLRVDVMNLSLNCVVGVTCPDVPGLVVALRRAVNYANGKGSLVVTVAQNNGLNLQALPGTQKLALGEADTALVVSAVGPDALPATLFGFAYSNYGNVVDLAAPGGSAPPMEAGMLSTFSPFAPVPPSGARVLPGGLFAISGGTSAAAPHVSGAAALLVGHHGHLPPALLRTLLEVSARDVDGPGHSPFYGHGLLDAWAALN